MLTDQIKFTKFEHSLIKGFRESHHVEPIVYKPIHCGYHSLRTKAFRTDAEKPRSHLSFPLLHCWSFKHIPHSSCLLLEELAVLCTLLSPSRIKWCGVLIHKMCVLSASWTTEILDLKLIISIINTQIKLNVKMTAVEQTCMTLGRMVLLKWSSRVGALKSLLKTSCSSS